MKLATYYDDGPRIGLVDEDRVWDLRRLMAWHIFETERSPNSELLAQHLVPDDMALFIRLHHGKLEEFSAALARAKNYGNGRLAPNSLSKTLADVVLMAPVLAPSKIVCCGSSYGEYLAELGREPATWPQDVKISFLKPPTSLIGHGEMIEFPADAEEGDYENELAIVIGRPCSDVSDAESAGYIFGYSVFNDACVRDIPKWTGGLDSPRGKAGDSFAPMGPWIVPAAHLAGDPNNLAFSTWVDGELRQKGNTSNLLWRIERIVAFVSRYISLAPGDIIATGSTKGNAHTTGLFLKQGQTVRCEIEGIGTLENTVGRRSWSSKLSYLPPPA